MTVLVEGFGPDAVALARYLAGEGREVRLAGEGAAPPAAPALRELGIRVESHSDLDHDPGYAEVAYLDVWTPEVAPRVRRLREEGTRVSCLGDLLLERWAGPTVGITGTAGKTTTTGLTASILARAGIDFAVSRGARAGNLWPTADLLDRLPGERGSGAWSDGERAPVLLLELTSSHLAFMSRSPELAAVISFWPDHLELHGGLARYRSAKETIVRHQHAGDIVVVERGGPSSGFADSTPAALVEFSLSRPVERGAFVDAGRGLVVVDPTGDTALGAIQAGARHPGNVVAAAAIAAAAGAGPAAIEQGIIAAAAPPWRAQPAGTLAGIPVTDDGMAATPAKAAATLAGFPAGSVVLIAGGLNDAGGGPVHASSEEQALLELACDEIARVCRVVVTFGEAGARLAKLLDARAVAVIETSELGAAVAAAVRCITPGVEQVVFAPLFPVTLGERERFRGLVAASA